MTVFSYVFSEKQVKEGERRYGPLRLDFVIVESDLALFVLLVHLLELFHIPVDLCLSSHSFSYSLSRRCILFAIIRIVFFLRRLAL